MRLKGKTALITGSSRGVGQQIALGLAAEGCDIMIHARNESNCKGTLSLLKEYHVKTYVVSGLLNSEESVEQLITDVKSLGVSVDILYNNAGVMEDYSTEYLSFSWDVWSATMQINVYALHQLCGAFLPDMLARGYGRIVNLTSGIANTPELTPYSASKWAVRKITEDLASKFINTNVKISALDPGWLRTDMGSQEAPNPVGAVLPGALIPIFLDKEEVGGEVYKALDYN